MSLYEERLTKDLTRIRDEVADLGAAVDKALRSAVQATLTDDRVLANETVLGDKPINRKTREINSLCYAFMAVHLPGAAHLRQIASILSIVSELERIGDYAVTIARESLQLPQRPSGVILQAMEEMAEQAQICLERAMAAFNEKNADLARDTRALASQAKVREDMVFADLVHEKGADVERIEYLLNMLILTSRLKRVCDRAKNICEETLFAVMGEGKPPKVYKVLFLDPHNNCQSQIAEAVARKAFPNQGEYHSAGRANEAELKPGLLHFMETQGLVFGSLTTRVLEPDIEKAGIYDVIVSLQGPMTDYLPQQPFRTVFLEWDVGQWPEDSEGAEERFHLMYREITARVRDLMETLCGEEGR